MKADQILPEMAYGVGTVPGNPPHQSSRNANAYGSRNKIMKDKTHHLRKIRKGRLPSITLPVRVCRKTHCRVECEMIAHRTEMLRVERQKMLEPEDSVGEDNPNQTKGKKGNGVLFPGLLSLRLYSKKSIKEFFKWTHKRVKDRFLLCLKNLEKVTSHRFGKKQQYPDKNDQLNPSIKIHRYSSFLKLLGPEYRHEEIDN